MKKLFFSFFILILISCSSAQKTDPANGAAADSNSGDSNESSSSGGVMDLIWQKANSPEGQEMINKAKEKLKDKETQEKLKGLVSKDKEKK
ncbi:MAG: hypothetical protein H7A24_04820 [Leptospiraceae bacterium]|nr:hypothetical protein [Leptospiraceae bacterium]MCP5511180.1 hypothetical protein [Leptospiraceae bacterium]